MTENGQSSRSGRRLQHRRSADVLAPETGAALPAAIQLPDVAPPGTTTRRTWTWLVVSTLTLRKIGKSIGMIIYSQYMEK